MGHDSNETKTKGREVLKEVPVGIKEESRLQEKFAMKKQDTHQLLGCSLHFGLWNEFMDLGNHESAQNSSGK